ncbi:MAG: M15 family metallopeptidase [Clostridia bacterium]|nr:M15 family metallopeptidase [Clostridia bacterium]
MKKRTKLLLTAAVVITVVSAAVTAAVYKYDRIYVFAERIGLNCSKVDIGTVEPQAVEYIPIESLSEDGRVSVDQSMMLVNTEYMLPQSFCPDVSEYKATGVYFNDCMHSAYAQLSAAVTEKTGERLYVSSDYRDAQMQQTLYEEDPLTATAVGASEHQTGLAADVYVAYFSGDGFIKSEAGRFVNSHSWEYGFIIRYPSYGEEITNIRFEPWHLRYVGQPHAKIIYNNHLTLEEYILSMKENAWYSADGYLISRQAPAEDGTLCFPDGFVSATVSADNTGCYIITVPKK